MRRVVRALFWTGTLVLVAGLVFVLVCQLIVLSAGEGRCYSADSVKTMPALPVALVLGTSPRVAGRANLYFEYRMDAAALLWNEKKVKHLLLSGDNRQKDYDEPKMMRAALIQRGIPSEVMTLDYAGFRTFDSVVRAKEVFGLKRCVVVSQHFHNQRALFIARHHDLDATAFDAQDVSRPRGFKTRLREWLARVKAVLDLYVLDTRPKFLGQKEHLPVADE